MSKKTLEKVKKVLGWIFGIFLLLSGLSRLFQDPVPALILFAMSAVLIPPALKWIEENLKIKLSRKMKVVVLVVGFIIVGSIAKPLGEAEIETASTDRLVQEIQEDKPSENEANNEPAPELEKEVEIIPPDYGIAEVEDLSLPTANRYIIRVVLKNDPATRDQIKTVSKEIVEDYKDKADAVSILFYYDVSQAEGVYTLAMVDWAPYGDWSQANLKKNQSFDYTYNDIVGQRRSEEGQQEEVNEGMGTEEEGPTEEQKAAEEVEPVVEAEEPKVNQVPAVSNSEPTIAFKIASLHDGFNPPTDSTLTKFENLLTSLEKKCPNESQNEIANYIFKAQEKFVDKGMFMSYLEVAEGIDGSIPEGMNLGLSCAEVAAAFVTLATGQ